MDETKKIIDHSFTFLEPMIKNYGTFYPIATAIKIDDSIAEFWSCDGEMTEELMKKRKHTLKKNKDQYKLIAIFDIVGIENTITNTTSDAISVYIEKNNEDTAYTYYYEYSLTMEKQILYSEPKKKKCNREIFTN